MDSSLYFVIAAGLLAMAFFHSGRLIGFQIKIKVLIECDQLGKVFLKEQWRS